MITVLAVIGGLGFLGLVIAGVLFTLDAPSRVDRVRVELEAQQAAWKIQEHARAALDQMLQAARHTGGRK
jgi:hypothetical protein